MPSTWLDQVPSYTGSEAEMIHGQDGELTMPRVSPGTITIKEEEYLQLVQAAALVTARAQGSGSSEPIQVGSSDAPIRIGDESPSMPAMSSASESGSPVTRRQLYRTKRGLINVSEHLREKLKQTKQALDEEAQILQLARDLGCAPVNYLPIIPVNHLPVLF